MSLAWKRMSKLCQTKIIPSWDRSEIEILKRLSCPECSWFCLVPLNQVPDTRNRNPRCHCLFIYTISFLALDGDTPAHVYRAVCICWWQHNTTEKSHPMGKSVFLLFRKENFHDIRQSKLVWHMHIAQQTNTLKEKSAPILFIYRPTGDWKYPEKNFIPYLLPFPFPIVRQVLMTPCIVSATLVLWDDGVWDNDA